MRSEPKLVKVQLLLLVLDEVSVVLPRHAFVDAHVGQPLAGVEVARGRLLGGLARRVAAGRLLLLRERPRLFLDAALNLELVASHPSS